MHVHRILELTSFIVTFAPHITINIFADILFIHSGAMFETNHNISKSTLF